MEYLRELVLTFVATLLVVGTCATSANAIAIAPYSESGDAGDSFATAQIVTGGPYTGIDNTIGGEDQVDFFLFGWNGGGMRLSVSCGGICPADFTAFASIYTFDETLVFQTSLGSSADSDTLAAGNYFLKVSTSAGDPPISSAIFMLNPDGGIIPGLPVLAARLPEPASMVLLAGGLFGLALRRRLFRSA